jgi:dienelactone hydrolase
MLALTFVVSACEWDPETSPGGGGTTIEDTYSDDGPFTTTSKSVTGYKIYYPRNLEGDHPIITWGNGTGAPTMTYSALLKHLASWGFVVIASNSVMTQNGNDMVDGIDYLIEQNNRMSSEFYGMLDTDHIATTGHSQGGGGAINAAGDSRVTCSVPIAPAPGSIRQVDGPVFLIAGATDTIVSKSMVRSTSYAMANGPTVFGIADGMSHMAFAGDAFLNDCEICSNRKWSVDRKNFD